MLTEQTKINYSWKKYNRRIHTTNEKQAYEESFGVFSHIHKDNIWVDDIPSPVPDGSTSVVQKYEPLILTEDLTVSYHKAWLCKSGPTHLIGFVNPSFDLDYAVRLFDNVGTEIPSSSDINWSFDYDNGVLWCEVDPTLKGYTLPLKINIFRYIGATLTADFGSGGLSDFQFDKLEVEINASFFETRSIVLPQIPLLKSEQIFINGIPAESSDYSLVENVVTFSETALIELEDIIIIFYNFAVI